MDLPGIARVPVGDQPEERLGGRSFPTTIGGKEAIGVNFGGGSSPKPQKTKILGDFCSGVGENVWPWILDGVCCLLTDSL